MSDYSSRLIVSFLNQRLSQHILLDSRLCSDLSQNQVLVILTQRGTSARVAAPHVLSTQKSPVLVAELVGVALGTSLYV